MNIFKSLLGNIWQDPNAAEVVKISTGQLYLVRPGNVRSERECIYQDAMATIRRVPHVEHNYNLVLTKVYDDGDQELLEDEDETDHERVFLITEELEFRTGQYEGEASFVWRDLQGDVDELYEYVAPNTNDPTKAFFETSMYRAMYERKHKVDPGTLPAEPEYTEFFWSPPTSKAKAPPRKKATGPTVTTQSTTSTPAISEPEPAPPVSTGKGRASAAGASALVADTTPLVKQEAQLYRWMGESFDNQGIVQAQIVQRIGTYDFFMIASVDDGIVLCHKINSSMNPKNTGHLLALTWNHIPFGSDSEGVTSWLFQFDSPEEHEAFTKPFLQAMWQTLHQAPWAKAKTEEQDYVMSSWDDDVEMAAVSDEEDEEDEVAGALGESSSESEDDEDEENNAVVTSGLSAFNNDNDRNSHLTVGYKGDRTYVVRGNKIGVFNSTDNDSLNFMGNIKGVRTAKGKEFQPKEILLHDQDTKMVLMNPTERGSLYSMDIEVGKIVEEWKVHDDINVDHMAPDNKFAQTTREQTLVGASHNALFRIDPRVSGKKLVDSQYKQYAGKNKFSGVTTTAAGKLAVASEKGDIRLFDSIGKNAKTALPPLGDPITGIDVTSDGRWIVATTKTYLLLIDTLIGEGKYEGSLGFDRSFPATAKPIPRRLQLRNEHVAYMQHDVTFTPARFNMGEGQEENAIVTSTGQFVVAWDFGKVKKGRLDQYEIKKYEEHVVQDNFRFGDDKNIVVALDNNVLAVNKKSLARPTRHSLSSTLGQRTTKSNIVNAPY